MDYEKMTAEQLSAKMEELNVQFKGYQSILKEAYESMVEVGDEYDKIKKILDTRNNG